MIIERAEGTTLYDTDGNAYIDGVSSLWCNVHGHGHPAIDAGRHASSSSALAHSTMLGLSHPPGIRLPAGSSSSRPEILRRVFFSDNCRI